MAMNEPDFVLARQSRERDKISWEIEATAAVENYWLDAHSPQLVVQLRPLTTLAVVVVQLDELDAKHSRLELIKPTVAAANAAAISPSPGPPRIRIATRWVSVCFIASMVGAPVLRT